MIYFATCRSLQTKFNFVQSAEVSDMTFDLRGASLQISLRKAAIKLLGVPGITTLPIVRTKFDVCVFSAELIACSFHYVILSLTRLLHFEHSSKQLSIWVSGLNRTNCLRKHWLLPFLTLLSFFFRRRLLGWRRNDLFVCV